MLSSTCAATGTKALRMFTFNYNVIYMSDQGLRVIDLGLSAG